MNDNISSDTKQPSDPALASVSLLACAPRACEWHRWESGQYETKCDNVFEFTNDDIKANDFKYCPFCGGSITEKQANDQALRSAPTADAERKGNNEKP